MKIRVLFFASLAELTGTSEISLDVPRDSSVAELRAALAFRFPGLRSHQGGILTAINSEYAREDAALKEGDEVAFLPPVSGG